MGPRTYRSRAFSFKGTLVLSEHAKDKETLMPRVDAADTVVYSVRQQKKGRNMQRFSEIPLSELQRMLAQAATRVTSASPDGWTKKNPLWGHCAVVAAIVQKMHGGELLRY